ncbi:LacI family DNA-binding transcriptional regulator [Coraliomargarita sp. SDUM461004]|uniref:LacI family DNA-binding transcriptional regulator n=1 Tax=Thalassobacterium sedimentorum TaxID=3041258 RepID=A0ABU1AL87_9BACT|nr:LacI family DNA-binding transcriptional regulator [Coraliomargarita sp. SDUM461004]MDQ8194511.1 LacI family DNA-binding transcriptional regulator [Coraliomargarita sp. SDUM461004]
MEPPKRITQRDLARLLNMSQVTVSRALSNSPLVSEKTKQSVMDAAVKLGYQPDPALSSLNAYRRTKQPIQKGQTIAWITGQQAERSNSWHEGALEQARNYGYRMETFSPNAVGMTPERVMKILYNRSVSGMIFAPRRKAHTQLNIDLTNFCAVSIGYTLQSPIVDRVITDHHRNVMICFEKLYQAGYRRIAMATPNDTEIRIEGRRISSYLYQVYSHPDVANIPIIYYPNLPEAIPNAITPWLDKWRPDAILYHNPQILNVCIDFGLRIPEDIALVSIALTPRWPKDHDYSGVDERYHQIGAFAVDTLVAHIRKNERGIPQERRVHMLEGKWNPGKTMLHRH